MNQSWIEHLVNNIRFCLICPPGCQIITINLSRDKEPKGTHTLHVSTFDIPASLIFALRPPSITNHAVSPRNRIRIQQAPNPQPLVRFRIQYAQCHADRQQVQTVGFLVRPVMSTLPLVALANLHRGIANADARAGPAQRSEGDITKKTKREPLLVDVSVDGQTPSRARSAVSLMMLPAARGSRSHNWAISHI